MSQQDQIASEAAEWIVKISTEECTAKDFQQLEQWKMQSSAHQIAFERLNILIQNVQSLKDHHINSEHPIVQDEVLRKKVRVPSHFSTLAVIFLLGWIIYILPWNIWTADVNNSIQSWQEQILEDNSLITASGKTVYNIQFTDQQRTIELLEGNILVDVAKDVGRPFVIDVGHAKIKALGTRFIVQHHEDFTVVSMLESKTRINNSQKSKTLVINAGQTLTLQHGEFEVFQTSPVILEKAWENKKLVVNNMPLDQVLKILSSYQYSHYLYSNEELAKYPVTAVLPLDQPKVALQLLSQHIGLDIVNYSSYVTKIDKQ